MTVRHAVAEGAAESSLIDDRRGWASAVASIRTHEAFGVDTESNSLYAYDERVCLIQISLPSADYVIDPLARLDLSALGDLFADPAVLKVFHAAEYDVMCLKRDFDFRFANLFDTMWAARILGWSRVGLADVLRETFGVHTSKRFQRYNWGKRPLEPEALAYARVDSRYLLPLQELQVEELVRNGRLQEAREVFDQVAATAPAKNQFDPQGFWRIKGAHDLGPRQLAVLRELHLWRDQEAARLDRPHFKVVTDSALSALARARPSSQDELGRVTALPARNAERYGPSLLQAIRRGEEDRAPRPPATTRPPDEVLERFEALRAWRKKAAAERGVDVDVVLGNAVLWQLARVNPRSTGDLKRIEALGDWKRSAYGEAILAVLGTC